MSVNHHPFCRSRPPHQPRRTPGFGSRDRGSALLTVLLLATVLAIGLAAQLGLARSAMLAAQRTFHQRDALGLAEAGIEEALDCFNQMESGVAAPAAWAEWTRSADAATRMLAPFDRDGRAVVTVKIHVTGWDGVAPTATIVSEATAVPFDGSAPLSRIVQVGLRRGGIGTLGPFPGSLVAQEYLNLAGQVVADSYISNPTGSATGPWRAYDDALSRSNTSVVVRSGAAIVGSHASIWGNLSVGPGVIPPAASKVSGTITTNHASVYSLPPYPTTTAVSRSYDLGTNIPATLPLAGHQPAADGRYYYFCRNTTVQDVTIAAGRAVSIVGTNTGVGHGIGLPTGAALSLYVDGVVNPGKNNPVSDTTWAGALHIFTTTYGTCAFNGNDKIYACLFAPNSTLSVSGGGGRGMLIGVFVARRITALGHMDFHFDESLLPLFGSGWTVSSWYERRSAIDREAVAALTGNFLP